MHQDEDAFFSDYATSHKKLSELGFNPPSSFLKIGSILAQGALGVAVGGALVLLGYLIERFD